MIENTIINRYTVHRDRRIIDAMDIIDRGGKGIAFVLNDDGSVLGSVTDGDIRRHILKKRDLYEPVINVANANYRYLTKETVGEHEKIMSYYDITALPLLDADRQIISIYFEDDEVVSSERRLLDVPVVIMAGGKGTRLHPYTQVLPKPLIPVRGVPITMHIMNRFADYGMTNFLLVVNYQKELIKAYYSDPNLPYTISFAEETQPLGTAGGLKLLSGVYDRSFFMTNCDILVQCDYADLYAFHQTRGNLITIVCAVKKEVIPYGTIVLNEEGYLKTIVEKPEYTHLINTGFYVINPDVLALIDDGEQLTMPELIDRCNADSKNVGVYPISETLWSDMGTLDLLQKMENELK